MRIVEGSKEARVDIDRADPTGLANPPRQPVVADLEIAAALVLLRVQDGGALERVEDRRELGRRQDPEQLLRGPQRPGAVRGDQVVLEQPPRCDAERAERVQRSILGRTPGMRLATLFTNSSTRL